jgi:Predicted solute binding protein
MKRTLTISFMIALTISAIVLLSPIAFSNALTGTSVSGLITTDTTWTQANSPYTLTGPVGVSPGVTLTIQPGVAINFGDYNLQVNGTLNAVGTPDNPIRINGTAYTYVISFSSQSTLWNPQTNTGSIIQNAIISYDRSFGGNLIQINNASPKIDNNTINIGGFDTGIYASEGSPIISNCQINGNGGAGSGVIGISLSMANAYIANNTIYAADSAIYCNYDNSTVIHNLIFGSNVGLNAQGGPRILQNNTISENSVGIQLLPGFSAWNPPTVFLYNNIQNNSGHNLNFQFAQNLDATYNWWGTTDAQAINQTITDYKNNFNYGNATFTPYLAAPNPASFTYLNATAGTGGSISSSGITTLNYGGAKTFTFSPNSGYHISDVLVNGSSVGAVTSYNVQNIQGPTTISAVFAVDPTPSPTPTATPTVAPTSQPTATPNPTTNPTSHPTSTPTATPTSAPTSAPTYPATTSPNSESSTILTPYFLVAIAVAVIAVVIVALVLILKRR